MKLLVILYFLIISIGASAQIVTPKDTIPDFAANPTITSTASGGWFDPATWDQNRVPQADDVVLVAGGHTVTFNGISNVNIAAIGIGGTLEFSRTNNRSLKVGTLIVYRDGRLEIGTQADPFPAAYTAEIVFSDITLPTSTADPITGVVDPSQYGGGFIVLGELVAHGRTITNPWTRVTADLLSAQTTIGTELSVSDWQPGDVVLVPDSRQTVMKHKYSQSPREYQAMRIEEIALSSVTSNLVTLSSALQYDHLGLENPAQTFSKLPHIGNLTRNVIFRSENPAGVRAHGMVTERGFVDIRYARFESMGRTTAEALHSTTFDSEGNISQIGTNQIGRYPIHFHHNMGPLNPGNTGYQGYFIGNVVQDGEKWGIAVHNSHFNKIADNIIYDVTGSSIMTEEGNEHANEFINNLMVLSGEVSVNWYEPLYGGVGRNPGQGIMWGDFGYEGSCGWFTGADNILEGNVAVNCAYAGIMFNARSPGQFTEIYFPRIPLIRGADLDNPSDWYQHVSPERPPKIRSAKNNEVYASILGLWNSFSNDLGVMENTDLWNIGQIGVYTQRNEAVKYTNLRVVNDPAVTNQSYVGLNIPGVDMFHLTYKAGRNAFDGLLVEGFRIGIESPGWVQPVDRDAEGPNQTLIENATLRNYVNVLHYSPIFRGKDFVMRNVEFARNTGPSIGWSDIPMDVVNYLHPSFGNTRRLEDATLTIEGYGGVSGPDLEVFMTEQAAAHVMETTNYAIDNCPTPGLTNQQCFNSHAKMTVNKIATCTDSTTYPYIGGFACPAGAPPPVNITVTTCADANLQEGDTLICNVDVSGGTGTGRSYTINPGAESGSIPDGATSFQFTRGYPDGDYSESITVHVDDDGNNNGSDGVSVTIDNIIPTGGIVGTGQAIIGQGYTVSIANLTDPGNDTITQYVLKVSGKPDVVIPAGNPLTYVFDCAGVFDLQVYADDEDGHHFIGTHQVTANCECLQ